MTQSELRLEVNSARVAEQKPLRTPTGGTVHFTPPLSEEFWWARVPLGKSQAVVCFPKFTTIGIGFQHETDWNTNLPYTEPAEEIFDHIKHNKGRCRADRETCLRAIRLLQEWAGQHIQAARRA